MKIKKLFLALVFIFSIISFSRAAFAADVHTCEWTVDNKFCVEDSDITFASFGGCRSGYLNSYKASDQVEGCRIGTCVPSSTGQCLARKYKIACEHNVTGKFYDAPIDSVEDCRVACCNVENTFCNLEQKKVCVRDRANGDIESYLSSITDKTSCDNSCRGADVGCFKKDNGDCKYGVRSSFDSDGTFYSDTSCGEVTGCFVSSKAYKSCGNGLENNDYVDVYYFDSQKNREIISDKCDYPDEVCFDADGVGGSDASCVTTKCVESCPNCIPGEFRNGESVCQNVPGGQFLNDHKSTGLNNYIFRCQMGQIVPDTRDQNRELRCNQNLQDDGRVHSNWVTNDYKKCASCGDGGDGKFTDWASFVPIVGPPVSTGLLFGLGDSCAKFPGISATKCDSIGDCRYDKDFIWVPFGSCNPTYPPSTTKTCSSCGGGGDGITNLCSREECNSLGDCQFEAKTVTGESIGATAGLALGTCASALVINQILCHAPLIGQAACPGLLEGSRNICLSSGKTRLYQSLIATFYSFGAGAASGESALATDQILINGKVPIGTAIILSKAVLANLSSDKEISGSEADNLLDNINKDSTSVLGTALGSAAISTSSLVPFAANSLLYTNLGSGISPSTAQIISKLQPILSKASFVMLPLSVARSFDSGTCKAEEPYKNNNACSLCGPGEGQWFCTQDRCDILGGKDGHCRYVPINGVLSGSCIPVNKNDVSSPYVTQIDATFLNVDKNVVAEKSSTGKSLRITDKLSWETTTLKILINTNERADCRYTKSVNNTYSNSISFDDEGFPTQHKTEINFSDVDKVSGLTLYFKCQDSNGNEITQEDDQNYISIIFGGRPDTFPPIIQKIDPSNTYLPETVRSLRLSLVAYDENDVAECKYSKDTPDYADMEKTFEREDKISCLDTTNNNCRAFSTNLDLSTLDASSIEVPGYDKNVTTYSLYIKCKDNSGVEMYEEQNWTLIVVPTFGVMINSPEDLKDTYNRKLTINVTSSVAVRCNYTLDTKEYFLADYGRELIHEHPKLLEEGQHQLKVSCRDIASNRQNAVVTFNVLVDRNPPYLTSIFKESSKLCVTVNEAGSECRYENKNIFTSENVRWTDAIGMIDTRKPNSFCASLDDDKIYYVMCRDSWENNATFTIYP